MRGCVIGVFICIDSSFKLCVRCRTMMMMVVEVMAGGHGRGDRERHPHQDRLHDETASAHVASWDAAAAAANANAPLPSANGPPCSPTLAWRAGRAGAASSLAAGAAAAQRVGSRRRSRSQDTSALMVTGPGPFAVTPCVVAAFQIEKCSRIWTVLDRRN